MQAQSTASITCQRGQYGRSCDQKTSWTLRHPNGQMDLCSACTTELWQWARDNKMVGFSIEPIYRTPERRKAPKTAGRSLEQLMRDLGEETERRGKPARWYSAAETAILIRAALKARFPRTKFSVKTSTYSMGASIRVRWNDGPDRLMVEKIAGQFAGATFDGMQDLKEYRDMTVCGIRASFGADYVFCERDR